MRSPVLFLVFNRPETTRRVFQTIREVRPPRLYVSADGPRPSREGEAALCEEVRKIATAVDWPCEVKTLFRDRNLGCRRGVSEGITWFFQNEEEGIIMEDDILPVPSFFNYCDELLHRYRNDERIATVCGTNLVPMPHAPEMSYHFSRYSSVWGWASWRRVWQLYDVEMKAWPKWRDEGGLARVVDHDRGLEAYFANDFDLTFEGKIDTWDYQLRFMCFQLGLLNAVPRCNQILNIGIAINGTHSSAGAPVPSYILNSPPQVLDFPLKHPISVAREIHFDRLMDQKLHHWPRLYTIMRRMRALPVIGPVFGHVRDLVKGLPKNLDTSQPWNRS